MIQKIKFLLILIGYLGSQAMIAQSIGPIKGRITDNSTGEGLSYATITCSDNPSKGFTTDLDGYYSISSESNCSTFVVEYLGYESKMFSIVSSNASDYNITLEETRVVINAVEIIAKKEKYDKLNPAVELIKEVIAKRKKNRPGTHDYFQYNQYVAKSIALNNVTKESFNKGFFKQLDFIEQYIDTLDGSNSVLSIYLKEKVTNYLYEKGILKNERLIHEQKTELDLRFFDQNVEQILDYLIQEVDVYDNKLFLLGKSFQNPISPSGLRMYRYYIIDTIATPLDTTIHLWTTPSNKKDVGFTGDIYINKHDRAISSVNYVLDKRAKINFASELKLQQKFDQLHDRWIPAESTFSAVFKYANIGSGILGKSRVINTDFVDAKNTSSEVVYEIISPSLSQPKLIDKDFWIKYRSLADVDAARTYEMIDSLNANRKFSFYKKLSEAIVTGFLDFGKYEWGPFGATYTFNPIEGSRLQLGGRTTYELSKKFQLHGYTAYGFRDHKIKYRLGGLYSFNDNFDKNPVHYIQFVLGKDQFALGNDLKSAYERNLLTSFTRGVNRLFVQSEYYQLSYDQEFDSNFRLITSVNHSKQTGQGDLRFNSINGTGEPLENQDISISKFAGHLRWAPNEKYIQIREKRTPIYSKHPIIEIEFEQAIPKLIGSNVKYSKIEMLLFKRMYLSRFGHSDILFEGGKMWGESIPYHLLFIPKGNQTYLYKHRKYNMMNFFEFVTDRYVSINYRHYFNGFIMNKIPLLNKLDLRSVVTLKALWGQLSDANNPLANRNTIQFPEGLSDSQFVLGSTPYIEGSVGIANIFKVLRMDLLKRFTYNEATTVPQLFGKKGLAIRIKLEASF